jgi:hypothetical protein
MITPHITGSQVILPRDPANTISPLSVVSSESVVSTASNRWKSISRSNFRKLPIAESSTACVNASHFEDSAKTENVTKEQLLRRPLIRRESLSVKDLLAQVVEEPGFTARLSKSMTDLKTSVKSTHESSKENRSVPRRDYMPVEVLALQTMDLEDEERAALCSRLSRSMTDLQLSPKAKAFDNITMASKVRRKLALTKSDSSQYMMPALPVREDSFNLSDNQNAQFSTPIPANRDAYIDKLIRKSTLSVKSSWYKKQLSQAAQPPEVHASFATSEPPVKQNILINSLDANVRKSDNHHSSTALTSPMAKGLVSSQFSRSMNDLSTSQQSFHVRLSRSHSSERMPVMPLRRGSVGIGSRSNQDLPQGERSRVSAVLVDSPQQSTPTVSSKTHSQLSKPWGWSETSTLKRSSLSSLSTDLSGPPCEHPDLRRPYSSEQMPMKPMRRDSLAVPDNETSLSKPAPAEVHAPYSLSKDIEELILKSASSVKSLWHLKQAVDAQDLFPKETRNVLNDTSPILSNMTRKNSTSEPSVSPGLARVSNSMSELRSVLSSSNNGVVFSELSRCHTSARMPTKPMRRGSINAEIAFAGHGSNLLTRRTLPAMNSQPTQSQHPGESVDEAEEREPGLAIARPVAKSNIFFDTTRSKKSVIGQSPNS